MRPARNFLSVSTLATMHHPKISVVTSPATPQFTTRPSTAPGVRETITWRVEERTRTVYIPSMCPPDQWSPNTIENAFKQINPSPTSQHSRSSPEASRPRNPARNAPTNRGGHLQAPTQMYPSRSRGSPRTPVSPFRRQRILFYHKHNPHYGFTNFSAHPVQYKGKTYPTSEHLFQSMKVSTSAFEPVHALTAFQFHDQDDRLAEIMRTCGPRPRQVFECARLYQNYRRPDWFDVNIQKARRFALYCTHKFSFVLVDGGGLDVEIHSAPRPAKRAPLDRRR